MIRSSQSVCSRNVSVRDRGSADNELADGMLIVYDDYRARLLAAVRNSTRLPWMGQRIGYRLTLIWRSPEPAPAPTPFPLPPSGWLASQPDSRHSGLRFLTPVKASVYAY